MKTFFAKTLFKNIPAVAKEELLSDEKFQIVESHWEKSIVCSPAAGILAINAIRLFKDFIDAIFDPNLLQTLGSISNEIPTHVMRRIRAAIREPIIEAGQARKLIRLRYDNKDRDVEPYSLKYEVRKTDGYGFEYFYGWDRTRGNHIKKFFLHEIQGASIINTHFMPRFPVEF